MKEHKQTLQLGTLRAVWKYLKKYRLTIFLTFLMAVFCVLLTIYVPVLVGRCIDLIVGPSQVDFSGIGAIVLQVGMIVGLTALFQWLMGVLNQKIACEVVRDIRNDAFLTIQQLDLSQIHAHAYGDLLSRVIADVEQVFDGLLLGVTQLFVGVLTIIGILFFMFGIHVKIALVVVLLTPLSLFVANFIAKRTYAMFTKQSIARGEQTDFLDEMIGNQKTVQLFSQQQKVQNRFEEINDRFEKASVQALFFSAMVNPSTRFLNGIIYAVVVLVGAFTVISGGISVGGLVALLSYVNQYTKPFNEISGIVAELQNALACASRVFELIDKPKQVPDSSAARVIDPSKVEGTVSLEHVSFSYTPEQKLISDFNLTVSPGQRIAIVGPTGCGKTTLINLLMRFYDVSAGSISVEGTDIRDITRHSLRKSFGMVLQETWLREGTILENIMMGKPDATYDEVVEAAKAAHAHSFIKRLPDGYHTMVAPDGGSLSKGEQQMICIARVMLCLPPMLILDEATSSIDTRTEKLIQHSFVQMMQGRTSFVVAHRLSTIESADVILMMQDGNVVEQGSHADLMGKGGFYAALYNSQFAL